jgi:FG-GAP repeat
VTCAGRAVAAKSGRRHGFARRVAAVGIGAALALALALVRSGPDAIAVSGLRSAGARTAADFNGDGAADLAMGVPRETVRGNDDEGVVQVLYGSSSGLTSAGNQILRQGASGMPGVGEASDLFGFSLAVGDFDGDGLADLAIGAPFDDAGAHVNSGSVTVVFGSKAGLSPDRSQLVDAATRGVPGRVDPGDLLGFSLAAGDLEGDGFDDLAIGVPREAVSGIAHAGAVVVLHGSPRGVGALDDARWTQGSAGVPDAPEHGDLFGRALSAGDYDGDGAEDLAVGAPHEDVGPGGDEGAVEVLRGSPDGVTSSGAHRFTQNTRGMGDAAEAGDAFGMPLASGDVDGNGRGDLVVGAFSEDVDGQRDAGAVNLLLGSEGGLAPAAGRSFWNEDVTGVPGVAGAHDAFAEQIAVGDLNGDGFDDLAVGDHHDSEAGPDEAGAVSVFYAATSGLSASGAQQLTQNSPRVPDAAEAGDHFGSAVAVGRFGGGEPWLAVAAHTETLGSLPAAGSVTVLPAGGDGVAAGRAQYWTQDTAGIRERAEAYNYFPFALASTG